VVLSIIWQGLFLLAEVTGGGAKPWFTAYLICISTTWLSVIIATWWFRSLRSLQVASHGINIGMLLTWATIYLVVIPGDGGWEQGASITNIAVGLIGFLAPTRLALVIIPFIAVGQFALLYLGTRELLVPPSVASDVLYGVYAWTIGYVAMLARRALLRTARKVEDSQESLVGEEIQVKAMEEVSRKLYEDERRIHAVVLNTLTAFARGSLENETLIRQRASESASVLRDLVRDGQAHAPSGQPQWRGLIAQSVASAQEVGLQVTVHIEIGAAIPDEVGFAIASVMGEAMNNVIRHADADSVQISGVIDDHGCCHFSVRDNGMGLSSAHEPRFGIRQGIYAIMDEIDGNANIFTHDDGGVEVQLTWCPRERKSELQPSNSSGILASFATPVIVVMWLLTTLRMLLSWSDYPSLGITALAFLWYTFLAALLWSQARKGAVAGWLVLVIAVAAPLSYVLQERAGVNDLASTWAPWASEAVVSLYLVLIGAGPWWAFVPVMAMWLLMQGDIIAELFAPGFVILVATAFFARSVRRNSRLLQQSMEQRITMESAAVAASEHLARLSRRYEFMSGGGAVQLLNRIAIGEVDIHNQHIQQSCQREEQLIRSVLRLDPQGSPLHRFLGEFALKAYELDRQVHFDIHSAPASVNQDDLAAFSAHAYALLHSSDPHESTRLSVLMQDETPITRLVVNCATEPDTVPDCTDSVRVERLGGDTTWLLEWEMIDAPSDR
jgi:signal transduction histidine kinase